MPLLVGLTGYVMAGHGDGRGRGAASCSRPVPPGLLSAQALGSSLPPPSSCRTPDPVHGLKNVRL